MDKNAGVRNAVVIGMIVLAFVSRLLPHPDNFSPVASIALFGAAFFSRKYLAYILPLVAMFLSDLLVNNIIYAQWYGEFRWFTPGFASIYGSFLLITLMGSTVLKKVSLPRVLGSSVGASIIFFLITNLGFWYAGELYPITWEGMLMSYTAALPFFDNTLAGNLVYSTVLFGGYALAQQRYPALRVA